MKAFALVSLMLLSPAALAQSTSASHYDRSETLRVQEVRMAEVLFVREVVIQNDKRVNAGAAIGAAAGYGLARNIDGNQRQAARIAAGALGGFVGNSVGKAMSRRRGVEIFVRDMSDKRNPNRVLAIVQDHDEGFKPGDWVFLVGKGSKTRVVFGFGGGAQ